MVQIKKLDNHYGDVFAVIPLTNGLCTIVDIEDYAWLTKWKWKAKQSSHIWYAVRTEIWQGEEKIIYMHRRIMHTPHLAIVHHINHFGLDNRKRNLVNMSRQDHDNMHIHI